MKSVFISRAIAEESPLRAESYPDEISWMDLSLVEFAAVPFALPDQGWIFFYSRKGVDYFFEHPDMDRSKYTYLCYGQQTANYCAEFVEVSKQFDIHPAKAQAHCRALAQGEDIYFVCGQKSLRVVHQSISDHPHCHELVVYSQDNLETITALGHYERAILTSPLNVESFFQNEGSAGAYIAIGQTTGRALLEYGHKAIIAKEPSEYGLAKALALSFEN